MTTVRLEPTAPWSWVKHSTTEPLRSLYARSSTFFSPVHRMELSCSCRWASWLNDIPLLNPLILILDIHWFHWLLQEEFKNRKTLGLTHRLEDSFNIIFHYNPPLYQCIWAFEITVVCLVPKPRLCSSLELVIIPKSRFMQILKHIIIPWIQVWAVWLVI